jgi:hypothetical protein
MSVIIIINNNPVEVPEDACMEIMHLRSENAALRAALKPLLRHRPDGDVGWRGNTKAKCGWILVSDILRIESALGKEAQP